MGDRTNIIFQLYRCAICEHEEELRKVESDNLIFNRNIECPNCTGYMKLLEGRQRTEVEYEDPTDQFGGYLFDDREPF